MSNDNVDNLIEQLESLRIQERDILQRLVAARADERRNRPTNDQPAGNTPNTRNFRIGDQVEITNSIRTTFGRAANINDRRSTVTKITADRIYIRTNNGFNTWRLPKNLRFTTV